MHVDDPVSFMMDAIFVQWLEGKHLISLWNSSNFCALPPTVTVSVTVSGGGDIGIDIDIVIVIDIAIVVAANTFRDWPLPIQVPNPGVVHGCSVKEGLGIDFSQL